MTHYTLFLGRFQPFHKGHEHVVKTALEKSDVLIIGLGGYELSRSLSNPFTTEERIAIIQSAIREPLSSRLKFIRIHDTTYNNITWISEVQEAVAKIVGPNDTVTLIGHSKDSTSFYLKMFPMWDSIEVSNYEGLSATNFREHLYSQIVPIKSLSVFGFIVNYDHAQAIIDHAETPAFQQLVNEYRWLQEYKSTWWPRDKDNEPVKGQFNTVDAVVTLGGNLLMIQRGDFPGKDQWALPGGFLNPNERALDGMIRELREETKITVPEPALRGAVDEYLLADDINRDPRGRIISHAYHINLTSYGVDATTGIKIRLPRIKGSDDAKKAKWFTLEEVRAMRDQVFGDHYSIITELIGRQKKFK